MSVEGQIVRYDVLRSLAFGSISGTYTAIGTAFGYSVRCIKVKNSTDANMLISFDGINNHDVIFSFSGDVVDYASNRQANADKLEQPAGITIYVKQESSAPTMGNVYVTIIYASKT